MNLFYFLAGPSGHDIVPATNPSAWERWYESTMSSHQRVVGYDLLEGTMISTVFVGFNIGLSDPPVLFETLVQETRGDGSFLIASRYKTWEEALAGHARAVGMARREHAEARA